MSTPKDTRVVVNFGFIELGSERFVIESYEWHDINVVNVL